MISVASIFQKQMMDQLAQLKSNPVQFLVSRQLNIPQNLSGSPQQMIEYITGQKIPDECNNNPNAYLNYLTNNSQMSQQQQAQMLNTARFFGL